MSVNNEKKNSFLIQKQWKEQIAFLSDEQKGRLLWAMFEYQCGGNDFETDDILLKVIWATVKQAFEYYEGKYLETCERNREKAYKRWNKERAKKDAEACSGIIGNAENADNDKDKDKDKDIDIDKDIDNDIEKEKDNHTHIDNNNDMECVKISHESAKFSHTDNSAARDKKEIKKDISSSEVSSLFIYNENSGFTEKQFEELKNRIPLDIFQRYMLRLRDMPECKNKYLTVLGWAQSEGYYRR